MGPVAIRDIPPTRIMLHAMRIMFNENNVLHYVKPGTPYVKCRIARCAPGVRGVALGARGAGTWVYHWVYHWVRVSIDNQRIALCQTSESPCAARSMGIDSRGRGSTRPTRNE